jgi:glycine hydroxymethyltransferase
MPQFSENPISQLTNLEFGRQKNTLNLIASENYPSPKVLNLMGSVWMNKYAEGYPGKRYYAGNIHTDQLEKYVAKLALQVFDPTASYDVNLQVLSGSPANAMVYLSVLDVGDTVLSMNLTNGGHLSHLHSTSSFKKFFHHQDYDLRQTADESYEIDLENFKDQLKKTHPKLTIIGFSAYPKKYEFAQMCRLAHEAGSLVLADIAHINGLVAVGLHDSPFKQGIEGADFVSMTTHKTLRGPRGAILFARKEHIQNINKTVFPGTSGGPHLNKIAAIGQCLQEILSIDFYPDGLDFKSYSQHVLDTCKSLEEGLKASDVEIISPTQTHLCLVKLAPEIDSLEIQTKLENLGIITNRNSIPFDKKTSWRPSGLRFGTAALASRGLTTEQSKELGILIGDVIYNRVREEKSLKAVSDLLKTLSWWY